MTQPWGQPANQPWPPPYQQWPPANQQWPSANQTWPAQPVPGQFAPPAPGKRRGAALPGLVLVILVLAFAWTLASYLGQPATSGPTSGTNTSGPSAPTASTSSSPQAGYHVPLPDQNPPDLPEASTYSQATNLLQANALYAQTAPRPVNCQLTEIDPATASTAALSEHLNELTACLMLVWHQPVTDAGYELPRPPVTVYTRTIQTPCGTVDTINAMYCAGNQQIYYAKQLPQALPAALQSARFVTELIVAHEFGHAIQARSAILFSSQAWEAHVSASEGRVYSRRLELQADCLSGQFVGSVAPGARLSTSDITRLAQLAYNLGDDVITGVPGYDGAHGSGASRQSWFSLGLNDTRISTCNTYTAAAGQVR